MSTTAALDTSNRWVLSLSDATTCGGFETLATFISEDRVLREPVVSSTSFGPEFSAVALDNLLAVIHEQDVICTNFKYHIDAIAILDGGYLAVGDRSGTLTIGVVAEGKFIVKHSCNIFPDKAYTLATTFHRILFQVVTENETTIIARLVCLCPENTLLIFSNLILQNGDIDLSAVKMEKLACIHETRDISTFPNGIVTVGKGFDCIAVYRFDTDGIVLEDSSSADEDDAVMIRVQATENNEVYLTLDSKGTFYLWDSLTLCVLDTFCLPGVTDFRLVESKSDQFFSLENIKLIVKQGHLIRTLSLPQLKVGFEYRTESSHVGLSRMPLSLEEIYVTEFNCDEEDTEAQVFFRCYTETSPERRLLRLVAKKRFEEAEQFAKLYGLNFDLDPVIVQYKLREVKDTFDEMSCHLKQCKNQLLKMKSGNPSVNQVLAEVSDYNYRLESFARVFGEANYSRSQWEIFMDESPTAMFSHLLMEDPVKAFELWRCFQADMSKQLKPGTIHLILQRIPVDVPCTLTASWICDCVVPILIQKDPGALTAIISWAETQVYHLEQNSQDGWPVNAITLCETLLKRWLDGWPLNAIILCETLLKSLEQAVKCELDQISEQNLREIMTKMKCESALPPLKLLIDQLHWLHELWTNFSCHLSLDNLKMETTESIVYRMLDRVAAVDLLPQTLKHQVLPYMQKNDLSANEVFASYVQDLMNKTTWGRCQYSWEEKIKAIIRVISDPKIKIGALLNLVEKVSLPIPGFVHDLVAEINSGCQHDLLATLNNRWNLKNADNIIFNYGMKPGYVKTARQVKEMAKFIISSGGPFTDVERLLSAHNLTSTGLKELHKFQCQLFVIRNQIDELKLYLKSLPTQAVVYCCVDVVTTAFYNMDEADFLTQVKKQVRLSYFEAAGIAARIVLPLIESITERKEIKYKAKMIKKAKDLEVHYQIYMSEAGFQDKTRCTQLLRHYMGKLQDEQLCSLANLLGLTKSDLIRTAILESANRAACPATAKLLEKLSASVPQNVASGELLLNSLAIVGGEGEISVGSCLKLAQLWLTHCALDQIHQTSQLVSLVSLMVDILAQSQKSQMASLSQMWLDEYFKELPHRMDTETFLTEVINAVDVANSPETSSEIVLANTRALVEPLFSCGQQQLALRALLMLSSLLQTKQLHTNPIDDAEKNQDSSVLVEMVEMSYKILSTTAVQILNFPTLDAHLALAYVLSLPNKQAVGLLQSSIKSCGTNFKKLKRFSMIAYAASEMFGNQNLIDSCQSVKVTAKWGVRLAKIGIPFKSTTVTNPLDAFEVKDKLVQSPHCDVEILTEFFRDFKLEVDHLDPSLMKMFEACLTKHSDANPTPALLAKAQAILKSVQVSKLETLKRLLTKVNCYNYEVIEFLLEKILALEVTAESTRGLELLRYLKMYTRCKPPTESERRECFTPRGEAGHGADLTELDVLPEISSTRLPYHHLVGKDRWKIITPELNLQTLSSWLNMAPVLLITPDDVVLKVASNLLEDYLKTSSALSTPGKVSDEFCTLLVQIDKVLSLVERKECAMWFCHSFLEKITNVGEKTLALRGCVSRVDTWLHSTDDPQIKPKAQLTQQMFTNKLAFFSTHWSLCKAGLQGEGELRKLVKQPEELIQQLYSLPCIVNSADKTKDASKKGDINKLCEEIADQHGINLLELRLSLIDKWVLGATAIADADQTMTFDVVCDLTVNEEDIVKRVIYLLDSRDREECLKYLAGIIKGTEACNNQSYKRALFCLLRCATEDEIKDHLGDHIF
ncbi:kinetochore-associated protein 1-like [Physella acuta]|uniref:kinetochore-associated protein 1-like n=1 Tax=Physella acuta TaxID=109671 RepID=UPI0027DDBEAD|nr:kinetochore-associated protein 1-like [Physella acuta]